MESESYRHPNPVIDILRRVEPFRSIRKAWRIFLMRPAIRSRMEKIEQKKAAKFLARQGIVLEDLEGSISLPDLAQEIRNDFYGLKQIPFAVGDVMIDIGANIGAISIALAKLRPDVTIYAYEPVPANFVAMEKNIRANQVENIKAFNLAVTGDGREVEIFSVPFASNSACAYLSDVRPEFTAHRVASTTLNEIFFEHKIGKCKLLKIDCEGAEYEILQAASAKAPLQNVEYLSIELHDNQALKAQGHSAAKLKEFCQTLVPPEKLRVKCVNIIELLN